MPDQDKIAEEMIMNTAALSIGYLAVRFIMQPENWPEFVKWNNTNHVVPLQATRPDQITALRDRLWNMSEMFHSIARGEITVIKAFPDRPQT